MLNFIKTFRADEDGALTIDWVVLTAAFVGLAVAVLSSLPTNGNELGGEVGTKVDTSVVTAPGE